MNYFYKLEKGEDLNNNNQVQDILKEENVGRDGWDWGHLDDCVERTQKNLSRNYESHSNDDSL